MARTGSLAEFIVDLAKALLRTGYYSAEHPEARRSTDALLEAYVATVQDGELRLSLLERQESANVLVAAPGVEDAPLHKVMPASTAELFGPKLADFMQRRDLVAFTLGRGTVAEELLAFLELMSRPPTAPGREEARRLDRELLERGVRRITVLFREDMVGAGRRLSWQASLALSRLRKDISRLPVLRGRSREELLRVYAELLVDAVRPLRDARLVLEILLNLDLAPEAAPCRDEALPRMPAPVRLGTAQRLASEIVRLEPHDPRRAPQRGLLNSVVASLAAPDTLDSAVDLIGGLVAAGVLEAENVPGAIRRLLETRALCDTWLDRLEERLPALAASPSLVDEALAVLGEMLRRGRHVEASRVAAAIAASVPGPAGQAMLDGVLDDAVLQQVVDALRTDAEAELPRRSALLALAASAGERGVRLLGPLARERDLAPAMLRAFETLGVGGRQAVLETVLGEENPTEETAKALLPAAAAHPTPRLAPAMARLTRHRSAEVRRLALLALVPLGRAAAEEPLAACVLDEDGETRRVAIEGLSDLGSRRLAVLNAYVKTLLEDATQPPSTRAAAADALRRLGRSALPGGVTPEGVLLAALQKAPRGLLARLRAGGAAEDEVHAAACRALAGIGTERCLAVLDELGEAGRPAVRAAARAAAGTVRSRLAAAR